MEEIVTIDGKEFKLTVDRPLTAQEKAQTIAEIKKQTCGTCGPRAANVGNNLQYGGVKTLVATCTRTTFAEGDTINMSASPTVGTGPYSVSFYYDLGTGPVQVGMTQTGIAEGSTAMQTLPVTETMVRTANYGTPPVAGNMQLKTTVTDSCPTGPLSCTETCIVSAVCTAPTCNFVVS